MFDPLLRERQAATRIIAARREQLANPSSLDSFFLRQARDTAASQPRCDLTIAQLPLLSTPSISDLVPVFHNGQTYGVPASTLAGVAILPTGLQPFNVANYGTRGDGVTNDTAAINATITAAGTGGTVFFPAGTYLVAGGGAGTQIFTKPTGQRWIGAGIGKTILKAANNSNHDWFIANATYAQVNPYAGNCWQPSTVNVILGFPESPTYRIYDASIPNNWLTSYDYIADMTIDGNQANQSAGIGDGIVFTGAAHGLIERVAIINTANVGRNNGSHGIWFTNCLNCWASHCVLDQTYQGPTINRCCYGCGFHHCRTRMMRDAAYAILGIQLNSGNANDGCPIFSMLDHCQADGYGQPVPALDIAGGIYTTIVNPMLDGFGSSPIDIHEYANCCPAYVTVLGGQVRNSVGGLQIQGYHHSIADINFDGASVQDTIQVLTNVSVGPLNTYNVPCRHIQFVNVTATNPSAAARGVTLNNTIPGGIIDNIDFIGGGAYDTQAATKMTTAFFIQPQGTNSNIRVNGMKLGPGATTVLSGAQALTGKSWFKACPGLNPLSVPLASLGLTAPALPASTVTGTNTLPFDASLIIAGGTVTAIVIGGVTTTLTSGTFRVPAGQTFSLTYSVAPTTFIWLPE